MTKIQYPNDIKIIKRKNKLYLCARIIVPILIIVFVAIIVIQNTNSNSLRVFSGLFGHNTQIHSNDYDIYAVILGKYDNFEDAKTVAMSSSVAGASGYVWELEDEYVVIASIYENEEDAITVNNNLSSSPYSTDVLTIKFESVGFNVKNISDEDVKLVNEIINHFKKLFNELATNIIQVDKGEITKVACASFINAYKSEIIVYKSKLDYLLSSIADSRLIQIKTALITIECQLDNMVNKCLTNNDIKYSFVEFTNTIYQLNKELII